MQVSSKSKCLKRFLLNIHWNKMLGISCFPLKFVAFVKEVQFDDDRYNLQLFIFCYPLFI